MPAAEQQLPAANASFRTVEADIGAKLASSRDDKYRLAQ
jgi:hypothetical protein